MTGSPSWGGGSSAVRRRSVAVDCPARHGDPGWPRGQSPDRLLELEQTDPVVVGVGEPGPQREADVGHTVDGAQLGKLLELDAPRAEWRRRRGRSSPAPGRCEPGGRQATWLAAPRRLPAAVPARTRPAAAGWDQQGHRADQDDQEATGGERREGAGGAARAAGEADGRAEADNQERRLEAVHASQRVREPGPEVRKVARSPGGDALPGDRRLGGWR